MTNCNNCQIFIGEGRARARVCSERRMRACVRAKKRVVLCVFFWWCGGCDYRAIMCRQVCHIQAAACWGLLSPKQAAESAAAQHCPCHSPAPPAPAGPVDGPAIFDSCSNCQVAVACQQFQAKGCERIQFGGWRPPVAQGWCLQLGGRLPPRYREWGMRAFTVVKARVDGQPSIMHQTPALLQQ